METVYKRTTQKRGKDGKFFKEESCDKKLVILESERKASLRAL